MGKLRIILVALVVILTISLAGCGEKWTANFLGADNINDWARVDWWEPHICILEEEGLLINGYWVQGPFEFRGDFTATFRFVLETNSTNTIEYLRMNMDDGENAFRESSMELYIRNAGDVVEEQGEVFMRNSSGDSVIRPFTGGISGLNRNGRNTLIIRKRGSNYTFILNFTTLTSFDAEDYAYPYEAEFFIPGMYSYTSEGGIIHFESVTVSYDGTMLPHSYL